MAAKRGTRQFQDVFPETFTYSGTLNVASLADGAGSSESITVPGAALGDAVIAVSHGVSTAGITVTANVTAANTVIVRFQNESGGTVDLASTTIRLVCARLNPDLFV